MAALSPIAEFARRHDPDRFLCTLFAPPARREALFALIAFNHELARAREAARTPLIALMRLQWWREAVEQAAEGRPPRRHEVAGPLHAAIAEGAFAAEELLAMVEAREVEAEEAPPDEAGFAAYLRGTAGGVAVAAGRCLGTPAALLPALQTAGAAYGLAGVLRSTALLAGQGRCLLPQEALAEAGLDAAAVRAAPDSAAVRGAVARLAAAGLARLPAVAAELRALPQGAVAAALPLVLARRDLRRLAAGRPGLAGRGFGDRVAVAWAGMRGAV
ncbi:squalene/phytoene synthase family protein [Siccirubricoccus phaeus]|uniref:squalene/phytoene synthase family protein n=1 Tax=Siccirubricoccus phaeus TaxID=2595053 RepID=UPI0011F2337F|nr:squalene/phytoene synthase family protein [Siccirubricoccus phaeus]